MQMKKKSVSIFALWEKAAKAKKAPNAHSVEIESNGARCS
jgi:hypothetical protein